MINKTVSLFSLSFLAFSFLFNISHASPLVVDLNKNNLNLDWSAMTEAQTYTLYVALGDFKGDIDVTTLASVEMGHTTNLYVPGIPSGLIIYAAVLGHASEKNIVSNVVRFMPFAGTITYPESGDVLMQVDDSGGIGTIAVHGTRNNDGKDVSITQISGDDGSGTFILTLSNGQLDSYTKGVLTTQFVYHHDGSIGLHNVNETSSIESKSFFSRRQYQPYLDCSEFESKEAYKSRLLNDDDWYLSENMRDDIRFREQPFVDLFKTLIYVSAFSEREDKEKSEAIKSYTALLLLTFENQHDLVLQDYLDAYDSQCASTRCLEITTKAHIQRESDYNDIQCNNEMKNMFGSCAIPDTAERKFYNDADGSFQVYYMLDGHYAGPYMFWYDATSPKQYACYDESGERHGERRIWYENKITRQYKYNHGVMLEDALWFASGNLAQKTTYQNGQKVEYINYYDAPDKYKQYAQYKNDLLTGLYKNWYENGKKKDFSVWKDGKKNGERLQYREDGTLSSLAYYQDGVLKSLTNYEEDGKTVAKVYNY